MVSLDDRLRPNEKEVAAKVLDGEATISFSRAGYAYTMNRVGNLI